MPENDNSQEKDPTQAEQNSRGQAVKDVATAAVEALPSDSVGVSIKKDIEAAVRAQSVERAGGAEPLRHPAAERARSPQEVIGRERREFSNDRIR